MIAATPGETRRVMFGIGWTEMVLLGVIALLVLGPDKLPDMARQMGRWLRELRAASAELRDEFRAEFDADPLAPDARGVKSRLGNGALASRDVATAPHEGFGRPVRRRREQSLPGATDATTSTPAGEGPSDGD